MKNLKLILSLCLMVLLVSSVSLSQAVGDYGSAAAGPANWGTVASWVVCATNGTWDGATAAAAVPPSTADVWIRNGHTIVMEAGGKLCKNITIETGALLWGNSVVTSPKYLRVYGTTMTVDGTYGGPNDGAGLSPYVLDQTLTITGSGTCNISRLQPYLTGQTVIFDMNVGINYAGGSGTGSTGLYTNGKDNTTFTINAGKTVTTAPYSYIAAHTSSGSSAGASNLTINIYGTLTTSNNATINLNNTSPYASTINVYNGGTLNVGSILRGDVGTGAVNINVNSGGAINGLSGGSFSLSTANTVLNGTASMPTTDATFGNLVLNNASGLSLGASTTISGTLTLTNGVLTTDTNTLTVNGAITRTNGFVNGNLQRTIPAGSSTVIFDIGDAANYTPVILNLGSSTTAGNLTAKTTASTAPNFASSDISQTKYVNRYWTFTNAGVSSTYDATFNFVSGDIQGGGNPNLFIVGKNDGTWSYPTVGERTSTSTQATGLTSFSDFAIGEQAVLITDPPVVNSPIFVGATSVSGTSTEANGTTINVFVDGSSVGTTSVSSNAWTKTGLTALTIGQAVKATATAPGKLESDFSNIVIVFASLTITTTSPLPNATAGVAYSYTLAASGGTSPYNNWQVISGLLPANLNLNSSTGEISGTPTVSGTSNFTVQVSDALSATATKAFGLTVQPGSLNNFVIGTISSPKTAGAPFNISITAKDANGNTVPSFIGTVNLSTTAGAILPTTSGSFVLGARTENVTVSASGIGRTISVDDGSGNTGTSNPFDVVDPVPYRSAASGNWNSVNSWEKFDGSNWVPATSTPSSIDAAITIRNGNTITVTEGVTVDQVTVDAGGVIVVNTAIILTIADGVGTDLVVNGIVSSAGTITIDTGATVNFGNGGKYIHAQSAGSIPIATWSTGSTCEVIGYTSGSKPGNLNQNFYNFTWNCSGQTVTQDLSWYNNTIGGDLRINIPASIRVQLTSPAAGTPNTITINGNIYLESGHFTSNGSSSLSNIIIHTYGNIIVTGDPLDVTKTNFSVSRGSQTTSGSTDWYLYGDVSMSNATTQNSSTKPGGGVFIFAKPGTQTLSFNNVTVSGYVNMTVNSGTTLDMGSSVFSGTGSFVLNSGAGFRTSHPLGINGNITSTGAGAGATPGGNQFSTGANYFYNGTSAQVTGSFLPATVNNLTINNAAGVTLSASNTVNGTLDLSSGILSTGANTVTVVGNISGGSSASYVNGKLARVYSGIGSKLFPIGKGANYRPLTLNYTALTGTSTVTAEQFESGFPGTPPAGTVQVGSRYWNVTQTGGSLYTYDITLDGTGLTFSATPRILKYDSPTTLALMTTTPNYTATGLTSLSDFALGEESIVKPPAISNIARSVRVPLTNSAVTVTATIIDTVGINIARLLWTINGTTPDSVLMTRTSGTIQNGTYSGVIPGSVNANGNRIEYRIKAISLSGADSTTAISAANSYFAGISPLSLTGVRAMDANKQILYSGYYCRVTGTVNSPNFTVIAGRISYMFQDAVGGMNVNKSSTLIPALALGDSIIVVGALGQNRGTTQLTPDTALTHITIVASGRTVPVTEITVAAYNSNPEVYESRLIRMNGLQRLRATPLWGGNVSIPVYQSVVADSTIMFIDADTDLHNTLEPTYPVTVTGVATQYTSATTVYNNGYQIAPRYTTDFSWDTEFEPNNTPATANYLVLGSALSAALSPAGDVDWFKFVGPIGHLIVDATNPGNTTDVDLYLYDSTGTKMLYNIDRNTNDRLEYNLAYAGTYFINVKGYQNATGPYTLFARIAAGTDPLEPDDGPMFGFPLIATWVESIYRDSVSTIDPGVGLPGFDIDYRYIRLTAGQQITATLKTKSKFPTTTLNGGYLGIGRKGSAVSLAPQAFGGTPLTSGFSTTGTDVTVVYNVAVTDTYYVFVSVHLQSPSPYGMDQAGPNAKYMIIIDRTVGVEDEPVIPVEFALYQNYPNPFNPTTNIKFALPEASIVTVEVYNILGQQIKMLINEERPAGYHVIEWNGRNKYDQFAGSGVYYIRVLAEGNSGKTFTQVRKMMMLK